MERITDFCQADLVETCAFFLDGFNKIYVWVGKKCTEGNTESAMKVAKEYAAQCEKDRKLNVEIEVLINIYKSIDLSIYAVYLSI